ncbi:MAG: PIN domain-containing protein [Candidatus Micrarchaeota archaeon]
MILLDTSAWIEYLTSTETGNKIRKLLYQNVGVYTCPITLAEISAWCHKNNESPEKYLETIRSLSVMLELDEDVFVASGRIYADERRKNGKISLIDCIIYTSARCHGLILWTKDRDFKGLVDVELI